MKALSASELQTVQRIVAEMRERPGPLIEVLHGIQTDLGFIPPAAVPVVAEALNLSRAEVHGVITFYHYFQEAPAGRHTLEVCRAESCQAMGAEALGERAQERLGVGFGQTSADGAFSLRPVYCLGNCACSPAVMIDGELYGRVTPERLEELLAEREAEK